MDYGADAYRRFLLGDDYGLEQVIGLYKDSLIFFLMQYVKSAVIAEELTEDTFVTLAVKKPLFSENAKFRTLFSSEDWNDYSETANNAAEAFLRNDKEKLSEYLYDPNYDAGLSDNSENLFDVLDYSELILIDGSVAEFETGKVYPAVYKFALLDSDMLFFLDIGLRKTDIGWKVDYIYLQG